MALLLLRASLVLLMAFSSSCTQTCETHGDVRLVGGLAPSEGILEICWNSQWGTVCNHSWDNYAAMVVCRQLEYPPANSPYTGVRSGSGPIHLDDVYCACAWPYCNRLTDCCYSNDTSHCSYSDDVGVHCIAPPGAPQNVIASDICSTSLTLSWQAPAQTYEIDIDRYNVVCNSNQVYRSSSELSINVNGLQPYTHYYCCVVATIAGDEGFSECTNVWTRADVPSDAPLNVRGDASGSTSISLSWSSPPYQYCIKHYYIYVREVIKGIQTRRTSTDLRTIIDQLHPYYTYECRVAAYTISEGTLSQPVTIMTHQDVPTAAPQRVSGSAINSTSISLSWSPPPLPDQNGLIQNYSISVYEVATGTLTPYTTTNSPITISSLHPYYTYRCSVAAYTSVGEGPQNKPPVIIETLQDIPSAPPENITTTDVSTTYAHLNWIPPPTEHHNGVLTGYVVLVTMANNQESYNLTSNTTELLVDSLTPDSEYIFAVAAQTMIGIGPFSGEITQQTKPTPINIAAVVGSVTASLAILTALLIATVVGYIGCRKLRKKQFRRNNDINTQGHVYDEIEILEPRQQKSGNSIHVKPQQHVKTDTDIDAQGHVYDDTLERKPGRAIHFKPHKRVETVPQGKEVKAKKKARFTPQSRDQQTASDESTEVIDPRAKLQSLTFCVSNRVHTFLEQEANSQTLNTEDTASLSEDEQPPPIPERRYLEDDTPCVPNLYVDQQEGGTMLQDILQLVQKRGKVNNPAADRICQPMLPRGQRKQVTRSDAEYRDKEQPTAAESKGRWMKGPALPRRPRKPECKVTQRDAKCRDRKQSNAAESKGKRKSGPALPPRPPKPECKVTQSAVQCQDREQPKNKSKQMNSPASDHIYQPLQPHTTQQENAEYQSLHFNN